jgi:ornithine cyclodeaminase/alanine dehydrogenase-like protein (mu-crystallin family)
MKDDFTIDDIEDTSRRKVAHIQPLPIAPLDSLSKRFGCDILLAHEYLRASQAQTLGELHHAIDSNLIDPAGSFPEIGQMIAQQVPGRADADEITLCDLTGTGIQDTAIATLAHRLCLESQAGTLFNS